MTKRVSTGKPWAVTAADLRGQGSGAARAWESMPLAQPAVHKNRNFKGLQLRGVGGVAQGPPASYEGPSRGASLLAAPLSLIHI